MHELATTFEEHVQVLATESPHALILEWGRRLELAVKNYGTVLGVPEGPWKKYMKALLKDAWVGQEVCSEIRHLRKRRNVVAHEAPKCIPSDEAVQYARMAENIVWLLGRAQDVRAGRPPLTRSQGHENGKCTG